MNYRHAYHAGNFGDCVKHALLVWLMRAMARKPAPFLVFDTHAGLGRYDLSSGAAERAGEWRMGIARLLEEARTELADYLDIVRRLGLYPGSPAIERALLRPGDRLVLCELHAQDNLSLRHLFGRDPQVAVHRRDAWEAIGALLPPPERRALVLIDPPYEQPDEFERLLMGLQAGHARFPTGVYAAWYPIKGRAAVRGFHDAIRQCGIRDVVAAELCLREATDASRLNGCGLLVVNPPYQFEQEGLPILDALLARLSHGEPGAEATMHRLVDE